MSEAPTIRCPGSGERSDRVHSSGAIMCPACNGAYLSAGMTVPEHEVECEKSGSEAQVSGEKKEDLPMRHDRRAVLTNEAREWAIAESRRRKFSVEIRQIDLGIEALFAAMESRSYPLPVDAAERLEQLSPSPDDPRV